MGVGAGAGANVSVPRFLCRRRASERALAPACACVCDGAMGQARETERERMSECKVHKSWASKNGDIGSKQQRRDATSTAAKAAPIRCRAIL